MKWINIIEGENKTLPNEGEEVIFDGNENPPIWGRIKYNGIFPSIACYDSSGEEEYEDVWKYSRWLDEPPSELPEDIEKWIEDEAKGKVLNDFPYSGSMEQFAKDAFCLGGKRVAQLLLPELQQQKETIATFTKAAIDYAEEIVRQAAEIESLKAEIKSLQEWHDSNRA